MPSRPAALAIAGALCVFAQQPTQDKLAPYYPTPESIVKRMLELGDLKAGEKMFDLGSGDGRIVIMAAEKFGADATGVELDRLSLASSTDAPVRFAVARDGRSFLAGTARGVVLRFRFTDSRDR